MKQNRRQSFEKIHETIFSEEYKNNKRRKKKKNVKPFFVGMAVFILFFVWAIGRIIEFLFVGAVDLFKFLF